MNNKHMQISLVILLLIAASAFAYRALSPAIPSYTAPAIEPSGRGVVGNAAKSNDTYDVLMTYTDEGFSPRNISIKKGQRVRFLNQSNDAFWPASGIHPTHTLYPQKEITDCLGSSFDSCAALKYGEFFDFTFYYTGDWSVHDHLRGYNSGSITVVS